MASKSGVLPIMSTTTYKLYSSLTYAGDELMTIMKRKLRIFGKRAWKAIEKSGMRRADAELARMGYNLKEMHKESEK